MKPLKLTDPHLQKPWLLISMYEYMYESYLSKMALIDKITHGAAIRGLPLTIQAKGRVDMLKGAAKDISEILKLYDQKIHDYIVSHNQPQRKLKTA